MRNLALVVVLGLAAMGSVGCGKKKAERFGHPNSPDGAKAVMNEFVKAGADHGKLSQSLRPDAADYDAVYDADTAKKVRDHMEPAWSKNAVVIKPAKPTQTEVLFFDGVTSDEFKSGSDKSKHCFPGAYKDLAPKLKPGVTLYCFKFVEPGQKAGTVYEGLTYVNGHWAIFTKSWHALK